MNAEAYRIAQELAALLQPHKSVIESSGHEEKTPVLCTESGALCTESGAFSTPIHAFPRLDKREAWTRKAEPLNAREREFARDAERRLREFYRSRYYARLRMRARRRPSGD